MISFIENRKIVIFGFNKYQKAFQFIFDTMKISYYIDFSENLNNNVYLPEVLNKENADDIFVIVCTEPHLKQKAADFLANDIGLIYNKEFCIMDDLFPYLDYNIEKQTQNKKVILWGTGDNSRFFMENYKTICPNLHIDCVVDSDPSKTNQEYFGYKIKLFADEIFDENCFFIIGIAEHKLAGLLKILKSKTNVDDNYIVSSRLFINKPSELLYKTIYDNSNYNNSKCSKYNDIRITSAGYISPCCMSRYITIGNIFTDDFEKVWYSIYEKIFRLSVINKTFTFCDKNICPFLINCESDIEPSAEESVNYVDNQPQKPRLLLLETDHSCNIRCFSCREEVYVVENEFYENFTQRVIENFLEHPKRIVLSGNGEVFASKYAKRIIEHKNCVDKTEISILSNGLAFNEHNWNKYLSKYKTVNANISLDAATEETYNKLRRGSNWETVLKNMKFLSGKKKQGIIKYFQINFVAQKDNVHELKQFVELGKKLNVDRVLITMLEDWNLPEKRYEKNKITTDDYKIKREYLKYFNEIIDEDIVDFVNFAHALGKKPKSAYMY